MEGRRWEVGGERWKVEVGYERGPMRVSVRVRLRGRGQQAKPLILLRVSGQTGFSVLQKRYSVSQLDDAMTKKTRFL